MKTRNTSRTWAAVLQRRPGASGSAAFAHVRSREHRLPGGGVLASETGNVFELPPGRRHSRTRGRGARAPRSSLSYRESASCAQPRGAQCGAAEAPARPSSASLRRDQALDGLRSRLVPPAGSAGRGSCDRRTTGVARSACAASAPRPRQLERRRRGRRDGGSRRDDRGELQCKVRSRMMHRLSSC